MSTHLPIRISRPLHRQCIFQRRPFSSSLALQKKLQRVDAAQARQQAKNQGQRAPSTVQAEAFQDVENLPDDLGLLPGTFVRTWSSTPSILPETLFPITAENYLGALKKRWKYERTYIRTRFSDFYTMFYYRWWMKRGKGKPKLGIWGTEIKRLAKEYYPGVYQAFATKNDQRLKRFCLSGLVEHMQERFTSRDPNVKMTWELVKTHSTPRIVSNRMAQPPFPGADDKEQPTAIRQVVVRLSTRQRLVLTHTEPESQTLNTASGIATERRKLAWSPDGLHSEIRQGRKRIEDDEVVDEHERDVVEYMVMQRWMKKGKEEQWKVWGFMDKTTVESIEKDQKKMEETQAYEAANPSPL